MPLFENVAVTALVGRWHFLFMKKNTYYFTHDYNAHNDTKILYLRQDLGMEGYGIYWYLIESLADSGGILPLKILPVLARQMDCTLVKVEGIIRNYELFEINENQFFSQRLLNHLDVRKALSDAGKQGANNRWNNGVANGVAIDHPNAKERKGKESKVDEEEKPPTTTTNSLDVSKNTIRYYYVNFMTTENSQKDALCMANRKSKKEVEIACIGFVLHLLSEGLKMDDYKPDFPSHFKSWFVKYGADNLMKIDKDQVNAQFKKLNLYQDAD